MNDNAQEQPRGIRNNNPGNIRSNPWQDWVGQVSTDPAGFCIFDSPEHGIRALAIVLRHYRIYHNCYSVRDFISRWAPSTENDTDAYVGFVALRLGVSPDTPLPFVSRLPDLVRAIIVYENGYCPYDIATIIAGVNASAVA